MNSKKKVLFVAPKFYNYHTQIIEALELQGYEVTFYPEMEHTLLYRVSNKLSKKIESYLTQKYIDSILQQTVQNEFDVFFVIRGGYFSPEWLEKLHLKLPLAKFIMYQWDSVRQNNYLPLVKYFDRVQTFDMVDAKEHSLEYLPLFYTKHYKNIQYEKKDTKYDLVFFGAYHSDRLEIIQYIDKLFKENGLHFKYHLFITKLALFRLLITRAISVRDLHYFKTYSVSMDEIIETYKESSAVLDVELAIQNGLTIRTMETLGANLKLLTTNGHIKEEPFYDSNVVMHIDRKDIAIDLDFFTNGQNDEDRVKEFYIESWLKNILSN